MGLGSGLCREPVRGGRLAENIHLRLGLDPENLFCWSVPDLGGLSGDCRRKAAFLTNNNEGSWLYARQCPSVSKGGRYAGAVLLTASECDMLTQPQLLIRVARKELGCMWICGGLEDRLTMASH